MGLLLHLHRLLFAETKAIGGTFKESDNLVVDRSPNGGQVVQFKPVPTARTEYCAADPIGRYAERVREHVVSTVRPSSSISDVRAAVPGISVPTIRLALNELKNEGLLKPQGTGRTAVRLGVTT